MSTMITEVLKVSIYISLSILILNLLKNKYLGKYTSTFKYALCIGIILRGIFIFKINIPIPKLLELIINTETTNTLKQSINYIYKSQVLYTGILTLFIYIWLIGVLIASIYYLHYNIKLYKNISNLSHEINDESIYIILQNQKRYLGINKRIKIFKLHGIYSLMLIGVIKPTIILPNRDYKEVELNYVFKHELIHYKRKDNVLKIILTIFNIIHWFNPFVYKFSKYFDDQCELSCDELVTKNFSLDDIKVYSMLLLDTMRYKNKLESSMCISHLSSGKSNEIKNRIEAILNCSKRKNGKSFIYIVFIVTFIPIFSLKSNTYANENSTEYINRTSNKNNIKQNSTNYIDTKSITTKESVKNMLKQTNEITINENGKITTFKKVN